MWNRSCSYNLFRNIITTNLIYLKTWKKRDQVDVGLHDTASLSSVSQMSHSQVMTCDSVQGYCSQEHNASASQEVGVIRRQPYGRSPCEGRVEKFREPYFLSTSHRAPMAQDFLRDDVL